MSKRKKAIITGISGQDGSYLAALLLEQEYEVIGTVRKTFSGFNDERRRLEKETEIVTIDYEKPDDICRLFNDIQPDEAYNLAAIASSAQVDSSPLDHTRINLLFPLYMLEAARAGKTKPRLFFALSSEVYGQPADTPQDEHTQFAPVNPYGIAKAVLAQYIKYYRNNHKIFCCGGILYNHESPFRSMDHVTRKITNAAVRIKLGLQDKLILGNLAAKRDWSHAKDFVRAYHLIMNATTPSDYVLASGTGRTVEELCKLAFSFVELDYKKYVETDPGLYRDEKGLSLIGNPSMAREKLGWSTEITFNTLIEEMIHNDMSIQKKLSGVEKIQ